MALIQDFNIKPYYDDYDDDNKFLRMLFRPGYALQARELTQLQTIVQKQISRFGKHIFKNGSVVTGGEVSISSTVVYHKLQTTTVGGQAIDVNNFLGKNIGNAHALDSFGSLGKVVAVSPATDTDPPTIFVEYKTALYLVDGETLFTIDDDLFEARLVSSDSSGKASVAYVNEGVYFIDDFFVKVSAQTLILEKYNNTPTYKIGLAYEESIVDETRDTTLLDPALESSNYQAPGANRYKVDLILQKRTLDSIDDTKFIEIVRIDNGTVVLRNNYPLYADLERTLARRTYDESGNYTVKPFTLYLKEHVPTQNNSPDPTKLTVKLSPGKAYVRGFEIETISTTNLDLDRARDTNEVVNYDISANYGNYVVTSNNKGLFDISTMEAVDVHNVISSAIDTTDSSTYNSTKIGTIRVRQKEYFTAANTQIADTYKNKLFVFEPRFTSNNTIKNIKSFAKVNTATKLVSSADVDDINQFSGETYFSDTNFKPLVFRIPQSFISFGMSDQDFRGKLVFRNQTVSSGVLNLSTGIPQTFFVGSGALSDLQILDNFYIVSNTSSGISEFENSEVIPFVSATGRSITVTGESCTLNFNSSNTFTVDVVVSVDFNNTTARTKTLVTANTTVVPVSGGTTIGNTTIYLTQGQVAISNPNRIQGISDSLYISDVLKLDDRFEETYGFFDITLGNRTVKSSFRVIDSKDPSLPVTSADLNDSTKDITTNYILDTGQKDEYYDHASITLKPGASAPIGQILVLVNYFTHTGSGYFTLDSYNNSSFGANEDERYAKIPAFTSPSTGQVYKLRDCIDFRPVRQNASATSPNFTLNGISIPKAGESLESDYSYYLPRIDRVVLNEDRKFEVIKGVSSLNPQTPSEPQNAMSLYTIRLNPYTFFPSDTQIRFIENKRYTMRDIGKLEKRIENIEYYTALNTLEKSAQDLVILDSNGLNRFKNGILVDSFRGHQVGDVKNLDYKCAMDFETGELRPSFVSESIEFNIDSTNTTSTVEAGTIVLNPYEIVPVIEQSVATNAIAVNPFTLTNYSGTLDFYPPGDFWVDKETRPDVLINLEGENDAWEEIGRALEDTRAAGWGNQWNEWNTFVSGGTTDVTQIVQNRSEGYLDYQDTIERTTTTTLYSKERYGNNRTLVPERIVRSIGNRQVDLSVIPYIREQFIIGIARGLRPNQYHYLFAEQGDEDATKYLEFPSYAWLYDVSGDFDDRYGVFEQVTSSSGGTATLLKQSSRSWSLAQPVLFLADMRGTFAANDTITGTVSGATAKIDIMFWNNGNVATSTANTITLDSGAPYDNAYVDIVDAYSQVNWPFTGTKILEDAKEVTEFYNIRIISGRGVGQIRTITSYNGTTKVATINQPWDVLPDSTSRWSVGKPQSDDQGEMCGRWFLPNYGPTSYDNGWRSRTGSRLIRLVNDPTNNPQLINSFAEEYFHAQGILNVIEDVSVSVRVPTIQNQVIYEREDNIKSTTVVTDNLLGTTLVADRTPPPSSGGSGCKIICSEMAKQGFFEADINEADQRFGRRLQRKHPRIYNGYVYWARTIVEWIKGKGPSLYLWEMNDNNELQRNIALHMTEKIARPWSEEMAYIEKVRDESSITGKLVFWIGLVICMIVSLFNPDLNKKDTRLKGFTIFGFMCFFYLLVSAINIIESPFKTIKNFFKSKLIRN